MNIVQKVQEYEAKVLGEQLERGKLAGAQRAWAEAVLVVFRARGLRLTREQRRRISECQSEATLQHWLERAALAATTSEAFRE